MAAVSIYGFLIDARQIAGDGEPVMVLFNITATIRSYLLAQEIIPQKP